MFSLSGAILYTSNHMKQYNNSLDSGGSNHRIFFYCMHDNFSTKTSTKNHLLASSSSVRLSVCHVREFCQNEVIVSSKFFHRRVAKPFTKRHGNIPMGIALTGASKAGGVSTNCDSGQMAGYRSMTAGASAINN